MSYHRERGKGIGLGQPKPNPPGVKAPKLINPLPNPPLIGQGWGGPPFKPDRLPFPIGLMDSVTAKFLVYIFSIDTMQDSWSSP